MKRTGKHYWHNLVRAYREDITSTYQMIPDSKPMPSESGHSGVIEECDQE
jgi:hypothetical protein